MKPSRPAVRRRGKAARPSSRPPAEKRLKKGARKGAKKGVRTGARSRAHETEAALAALAHEIRTPLTGILALSELIAATDLPERERRWAQAVKSAAEHLAQLTTLVVDGVRADARGLVLQQGPFRLRGLAEAVAASLAARAEAKGLTVDIALADELPALVLGDQVRLRAALENLIDNAVKFTDRGRVALTVSVAKAARGRHRLVFCVTDSGVGLTAKEVARLFRPFSQANAEIARRYGGSGLGLVFVKRIAKAMGGSLTVDSAPGRGSTFRLVVALAEARQGTPGTEGADRVAPTRSLRILCAEDNPYARVVLNTILTEMGHRVDFVGGGEAAIQAAERGYDVVLMDVALPDVDGIEATRRIRALPGAGGVAIVGISGHSEPGHEAAARAAGMNAYLAKPVSPTALARALAELVPG